MRQFCVFVSAMIGNLVASIGLRWLIDLAVQRLIRSNPILAFFVSIATWMGVWTFLERTITRPLYTRAMAWAGKADAEAEGERLTREHRARSMKFGHPVAA